MTVRYLGYKAERRRRFNSQPAPVFTQDFVTGGGGALPQGATFSRGTIGTLYNQSGLVAYAPSNLNLYSQDFTNAAWIKVASTFGTSGTAPDGTATMALVNTINAVTSYIQQVVTVTASTTYTVSYYVKQGTSSAQLFKIFDGTIVTQIATASVSWPSGVPTLSSITGYASTSIAPVGNGIYRFTGTFSSGANTSIGTLFYPDGANTGLNAYVWGAQLEQGSNATTYTPTTTVAVYGPRFDFDPGNVLQQNFFLNSQNMLGTGWTPVLGALVTTSGVAAPDGTYTANTITFNTTAANRLEQTVTSLGPALNGETLTFSVWLQGTGTISIAVQTDTGVGGATENIVTLSSTWTRFTATVTFASPTGNRRGMIIWRSSANDTATYVNAWGAQLNDGSTALPYLPTTSTPQTVCAPRGLLIEETRTNLLTYSDQFDNAVYSKSNSTVTANSATSPDGTTNADSLIRGATNVGESMLRITTTQAISTAYTFSVYAKAVTAGAYLYLRNLAVDGGLPSGLVVFNLANGTIVSSGSSYPSPIITSVGNGWYRCVISGTTPASITNNLADIGVCNVANAVTGISGDTIYIYGAQLEAGAFATSYIPTTSATVTRNFDNLNITSTNFASWFNQTTGTFAVQYDVGGTYSTQPSAFTANTTISGCGFDTSSAGHANWWNGATNLITANVIGTLNTTRKEAMAYAASSRAICLNGGAIASDANVPFSGTLTGMYFGNAYGTNSQIINGHLRSFSYYNYALTNAQLQQVTT